MDTDETAERIAHDLAVLGVRPGDTILVHSSLKSLGPFPGGTETVIRGLMQSVGESGTLLMPALSYRQEPIDFHDSRNTPANVGALPEAFRQRHGTIRSVHPTHSVCACGARADVLLKDHLLDNTPCGPHSPFSTLTQSGGKIVMLGCGLRPNTTMHAIEEMAHAPYVFGDRRRYTILDPAGQTICKEYITHGFRRFGCTQRYDRIGELPEMLQYLRRGRVLQSDTYVIDSEGLRSVALARMKEDPLFFVDCAAPPR